MNFISMALFTAQGRYWHTLIPALIGNWELYPGFKVKMFVAKDAMEHPMSHLLDKIAKKLPDRFEFQVYDQPYLNCEPTLWRLRPLWDDTVDVLLCRDIDSVPSTKEVQAVRMFLSMNLAVHSIRSYHLHDTLLMAGLCGFRVPMLGALRNVLTTFDIFQNAYQTLTTTRKNYDWGCDQEALCMLFNGMHNSILDCPIGNCRPHHPGLQIPTVPKDEIYQVPVYDLNSDLLAICNEITAIPWGEFEGFAGRPQGDFRPYMDRMLALPLETVTAIKAILAENPDIETFYKP